MKSESISQGQDPTQGALPLASVFVGRRRELSILQSKIDEAAVGRASMVVLVGEAGVGKTRVAQEFAHICSERGIPVPWARCFQGECQPPYGPWVEALGNYIRACEPEYLRQALGGSASILAQLLPKVREKLPDIEPAMPLGASGYRLRLYDSVVDFLFAIARDTAALLVLDDLHWVDLDSLGLLRYLARQFSGSHLLVVGAYRDPEFGVTSRHPLLGTLALVQHEAGYESIELRGLTEGEVAEYLSQGGRAWPSAALASAIHAETSGNPLYVREVYRHMVEEGHSLADADLGDLAVPTGLRQVVARRLSRLPPEAQKLLRLASGFTGGFGVPVLRELGDLPEDDLLDCLDHALEAGLLRVSATAPASYDFSHAIVRHILYEEMNPDRRARLHRRIAQAYERVFAGHEREHAAEIASQYHASRVLPGMERCIAHALAAAEQADSAYAYEAAATYLRMARDLASDNDPVARASILRRLAWAEAIVLDLNHVLHTTEEALTVLQQIGTEPTEQAELLMVVARFLGWVWIDPSVSNTLIDRGLALLGDTHNLTWARLILHKSRYERISEGLINAGRWLALDPEAVTIVRTEGSEVDYAFTLDEHVGWRPSEEIDSILTLVRTWKEIGAVWVGLTCLARAWYHNRASLERGFDEFARLARSSERERSIAEQMMISSLLATLACQRGDLPLAQQESKKALQLLHRLGSATRNTLLIMETGLTYFLDGDWQDLATRAAQTAGPQRALLGEISICVGAMATFAYARSGDEVQARRYLAVLTPILERLDARATYQYGAALGWAAAAVWQLGAVEFAALYRRLALDLSAKGVTYFIIPTQSIVAQMSALRGDAAEAQDRFRQARDELGESGSRPQRAILDYDEALALFRCDSADRKRIGLLIASALSAFQDLDMHGWAQRVLDLQKKLLALAAPVYPILPDSLTEREAEVLRLLARGQTVKQVGQRLIISPSTVERHIANIYAKIGARNRADATAYALRHDLLQSPSD